MGLERNKKRGHYFQTIARHFFRYRGAPFFLSSKDLDLIARWERMKIPLRTVLEGMKQAFEKAPPKFGNKGKISSLVYCQHHVQKSFEQYQERKVGRKHLIPEKEEKRKKARTDVERFLQTIPPQIKFLRDVYSRAYKMLSAQSPEEEELERMEEEVERLLIENSTAEVVKRVKRQIRKDYGAASDEEFVSIWRTKLVKRLRERHEIPYISLFYY